MGPLILIGYDRRRVGTSPWFTFSRRRDGTEYGLVYHETLAGLHREIDAKVQRGDLGSRDPVQGLLSAHGEHSEPPSSADSLPRV